ncbi:MAG: hypothetical protein EBZ48_16120 [Proteobacteria bacterium]|nr:hypothetical protein [Pseudomonadota bacterium]
MHLVILALLMSSVRGFVSRSGGGGFIRVLKAATNGATDYEFLDCGNQRRLERFGKYLVARNCPSAIWAPGLALDVWGSVDFQHNGEQWIGIVSEYYCEWGHPKEEGPRYDDAPRANLWIEKRLLRLEADIAAFETNTQSAISAAAGKRVQPGRTYPALEGHWIPQHYYMFDCNGASLVPIENALHFERIEQDFASLMTRYAPHYPAARYTLSNAPRLNTTRFGSNDIALRFCPQRLSPTNVELVQRVYKRDFELFGYSMQVPPAVPPRVSVPQVVSTPYSAATDLSNDGKESDARHGEPSLKRPREEQPKAQSPPPPNANILAGGSKSLGALLAAYRGAPGK